MKSFLSKMVYLGDARCTSEYLVGPAFISSPVLPAGLVRDVLVLQLIAVVLMSCQSLQGASTFSTLYENRIARPVPPSDVTDSTCSSFHYPSKLDSNSQVVSNTSHLRSYPFHLRVKQRQWPRTPSRVVPLHYNNAPKLNLYQ